MTDTTSSPDVVKGRDALDLPPGSWIVACNAEGRPWGASTPILRMSEGFRNAGSRVLMGRLDPPQPFRVLYRAPAPVTDPPELGGLVERIEQLDELPNGTALRLNDDARGAIAEVCRYDDGLGEIVWVAGFLSGFTREQVRRYLPARVLDVPDGGS